MTFWSYLKDKQYFFLFYFLLMSFISIMMFLLMDIAYSNMVYIHICSVLLAMGYVVVGYFYHRRFFMEVQSALHSRSENSISLLPKPQNEQQRIYLAILKKIEHKYVSKVERYEEEKQEQQEFVMSWIHEVKLPISASRLLLENSEGKPVEDLVDKLEDELNKIENYVEQALYYSRIDSFSKDYFIKELDVREVIKKSVKKYAKLFITKEISLTLFEEPLFIQSDSKWLGFSMDQMIANALKYTDVGGEISIQTEEDAREKRVIIKDSGIGISEQDIGRVFEKGFTGANGRLHTKSTGMGLYIANQLAIKLGHTISIESIEGAYTQVTIHFLKIRHYLHM